MVVARPVEPGSANFDPFNCTAPIVPTKILTDPEELDRQILQNGYATALYKYMEGTSDYNEQVQQNNKDYEVEKLYSNGVSLHEVNGIDTEKETDVNNSNGCELNNDSLETTAAVDECDSPVSETEKYTVTLHKGDHGLGKCKKYIFLVLIYSSTQFLFLGECENFFLKYI